MIFSLQEKEKYELIEDDVDDTQGEIAKVPMSEESKKMEKSTKKDPKEDKGDKDGKREKGGKQKVIEEEIVVIKRDKKPRESIEAPQKIKQDAEIIEALEEEVKSWEMDAEVKEGIAAKISRKLLRASKRPGALKINLEKACKNVCDIKVCCKDIVDFEKQMQEKEIKRGDKVDIKSIIALDGSERSYEIGWKSIKKSPSTDLLLSQITELEPQDIEKDITESLLISSLNAKWAKQKNRKAATLELSREKSLDTAAETENSDAKNLEVTTRTLNF